MLKILSFNSSLANQKDGVENVPNCGHWTKRFNDLLIDIIWFLCTSRVTFIHVVWRSQLPPQDEHSWLCLFYTSLTSTVPGVKNLLTSTILDGLSLLIVSAWKWQDPILNGCAILDNRHIVLLFFSSFCLCLGAPTRGNKPTHKYNAHCPCKGHWMLNTNTHL